MAIGWFLCPYKKIGTVHPQRICAMNDFTAQITADGGRWAETEILGDRAIVKVNAATATLNTIAGTATFRRIPLAALNDPLSSLTVGQRNAIQAELLDAGYTQAEITAAIPNLQSATLGQVLRFLATRRRKPRYDVGADVIVFDGEIRACRSIDSINEEVR